MTEDCNAFLPRNKISVWRLTSYLLLLYLVQKLVYLAKKENENTNQKNK
jgi:hypothetical protein